MKPFLQQLSGGIHRIVRILNGTAILAIAAIILLGIITRAVGRPIPRLEEITPDLFVWITFLGAAEAVQAGGHLSTDLLVERLPPRPRRLIQTLTTALAAILLMIITAAGARAVLAAAERKEMTAAGYPAWWILLALPVGALLAFLACLGLLACRPSTASPSGRIDATSHAGLDHS